MTDHEWARREGMQAFAGYPLLLEDRVLGVMAMFSRQPLERFILDELAPISGGIAQFLERRGAAEELRNSNALKISILETALDAIVAINHVGRIVEFNAAAETMFGYLRRDVIGRPIADLIIPPQFRAAHRSGLARVVNTGESRLLGRRIQIAAMRSDGSQFPVELAIARVPMEGRPVFTASIRALPNVVGTA